MLGGVARLTPALFKGQLDLVLRKQMRGTVSEKVSQKKESMSQSH